MAMLRGGNGSLDISTRMKRVDDRLAVVLHDYHLHVAGALCGATYILMFTLHAIMEPLLPLLILASDMSHAGIERHELRLTRPDDND